MLLSGCILMVSWSIMYVEIYRLTKSVWPCVIMHAIEDAVPTVLVTITGIIALTNSSDLWLNPISGVVATIIFLGIGIVLRSIRIKKRTTIKYERQSMIHTIEAKKSKEFNPYSFLLLFDMINIHLTTLALYIFPLQSHTLLLGKSQLYLDQLQHIDY